MCVVRAHISVFRLVGVFLCVFFGGVGVFFVSLCFLIAPETVLYSGGTVS